MVEKFLPDSLEDRERQSRRPWIEIEYTLCFVFGRDRWLHGNKSSPKRFCGFRLADAVRNDSE